MPSRARQGQKRAAVVLLGNGRIVTVCVNRAPMYLYVHSNKFGEPLFLKATESLGIKLGPSGTVWNAPEKRETGE